MKQNFYFKHDAPSATNPKLAKLLQKEGARGYGVYWLLIELLRLQTACHRDRRLGVKIGVHAKNGGGSRYRKL